MAEGIAIFNYPGITDYESVSCEWRTGIEPSVCTVVAPVSGVAALIPGGTMTILYNNPLCTITWTSANISSHAISYTEGHLVTIDIVDRRWKWKFSSPISGWYNKRKKDGIDIEPATERTPRQLLTMLLQIIGETNVDLGLVPDDARPEVKWDIAQPASELGDLCDKLGCVVVPMLNGSISIIPIGTGMLPEILEDHLISPEISYSNIERPDRVASYSAPVQVQTRWTLEAVGEDRDGTFKPLQELSYFPEDDGYFLPDMANVPPGKDRTLALRSVYRTYRILRPGGKLNIEPPTAAGLPGGFPFTDITLCDFETELLTTHPPEYTRAKAIAIGTFCNEESFPSTKVRTWEDEPTVDTQRRLVQFSRPCYIITIDGFGYAPARMFLETTCKLRFEDNAYVRVGSSVDVPGPSLGTGVLSRTYEDVPATYQHIFDDEIPDLVVGEVTNGTFLASSLSKMNLAMVAKWTPQVGGYGTYAGIIPFELDGKRTRVQWTFSVNQAPKTVLVAGTEVNPYMPGEEQRRKNRALDRVLIRAQANELKRRDVDKDGYDY